MPSVSDIDAKYTWRFIIEGGGGMSEGIFLTDDYQGFLSQISTIEKRIQQIISKTCDALGTINTDYDLFETETQIEIEDESAKNFGELLLDATTIGSVKIVRQQVNAHKKAADINSEIKEKIKDCKDAFRPLYKYIPNITGTAGILTIFSGVLDGLYNADASQAENINIILDSYGLISGFTPTYATTNLTSIRDNTKKPDLDVREHDSYSVISLKQAFLGDFSEDQTMFGTGIGLVLQFIPFVDTACDIRDVAGDGKNIYEYENSNDKSWGKAAEVYGFTALDVVGFIPLVGAVKYIDEISDGAKAVDKVNDTRKAIDKINDARKNLSKVDDIRDAAKGASKSTEVVTDTGKAVEGSKDVGKATISTIKQYDKSVLNTLKNTENFKESTIEHIFEGQVKQGNRANGYHYNSIDGSAGKVIDGTQTNKNTFGAYNATVEINGFQKQSSMFPDEWTPQEVIDAINEAYSDRIHFSGKMWDESVMSLDDFHRFNDGNIWCGSTSNGMYITMYLDDNEKIISAFPTITLEAVTKK